MDIKIKNDNIKFKVRVSAVIVVDNKLLVDTYQNDTYNLPGGYVELGESSKDALLREVLEEVNINVKIDKFMGIMENFFTNRTHEYTQAIEFYYKVSPTNINEVNLNDYDFLENDKGYEIMHHYKWIRINSLDNYNIVPNVIIPYIKENREVFHIINDINKKSLN